MAQTISKIIAVVAGWILDRLLGDPTCLPHPVVGFGKAISFFEKRLNRGKGRRIKGAFTAFILIITTFVASYMILSWLSVYPYVYLVVSTIIVFFCLAGKTLEKEVTETFKACEKSLEDGRKQVARIVGRDTKSLSDQEVKAAALETLSENLSDGVIAPLFWYAVLGVPGILTYKMINTLDSMIGYRNERYLQFGTFAARIDDIANYIPARLTAFIMLLVSGRLNLTRFVMKYGRAHLSPNSGYPEAALAGILNCRFGGPHDYFGQTVYKPYIGKNERAFTFNDVKSAVWINRKSEFLMLLITTSIILLIG